MTNRNLSDRLDDSHAEAWRPNVGDKLIGEIIELSERHGDYSVYPIVVVQTDAGEHLAVHAYHTVLKDELAKQKPKVGERIGIAYFGKPAGKDYEKYKVVVERTRSSIDWNAHAEAAQAEMAADDAGDVAPF